ncbi:MAG: DUF2330 domain-containing protein [Victivallaceae bacterium]|jgi:hypothetical protein
MKYNISIFLLLLTMTAQVMADGKMYWRESVPPKIPYQRALILFKDGTETLVLQSKYEIPKIETKASLGWVVPVPSEPQIASLPADLAKDIFGRLSMNSRPEVTLFGDIIVLVLLLGLVGLSVLTILFCHFSSVVPLPGWFMRNRSKLERLSLYSLLLCFIVGFFFFILLTPLSASPGVDVIKEQRVGIYNVKVVKSANSDDLIAWLNKNEFKFGKEDKAGFDSYISRGWCFVVANIKPTQDQKEQEIVSEGLAAPLILRFFHIQPVYPVVLTGTGNHDTEILIYMATSSKMNCGDRLTLRFAGKIGENILNHLAMETEPKDFFKPQDLACSYLCKFRDVLPASKMTQDITFTPASDNTPYQEHIVKW